MKKRSNISLLLKKIEGEASLSDTFHKKTNNAAVAYANPQKIPQTWIKIHFKTYPRLERVALLSTPQLKGIAKIMHRRRSMRDFSGAPISKNMLSYILYSACGLIRLDKNIDNSRRPYPSAGARYSIEVYPVILRCAGMEKGLYHYNVGEHTLELLLKKDLSSLLEKIMGKQPLILTASAIFIITGVLDRNRIKYGDRGYRFALLEAGHLGQNLCLLSTELGLGSCPIGGYIDSAIDSLLDIGHTKEYTLYTVAVGTL